MKKSYLKKLTTIVLFSTLFFGCSFLPKKIGKEEKVTFITEKGEQRKFSFIDQQFNVEKSKKFIVANTAFIIENSDTWNWEYGIITADGTKLEYVKAELVGPNFTIMITDDNQTPKIFKGKNSTEWIDLGVNGKGKITKKIYTFKDGENIKAVKYDLWEGRSKSFKGINLTDILTERYYKYLIKFTIKNRNENPEIIYQPCAFPIIVKGEQGTL